MGSRKIGRYVPVTREQWQEAFILHATTQGGMDRDTASYEAQFAAEDQLEQSGGEVSQWSPPADIAGRVADFWERRLLADDVSPSDLDFDDLGSQP
jgi:hypothetical protein